MYLKPGTKVRCLKTGPWMNRDGKVGEGPSFNEECVVSTFMAPAADMELIELENHPHLYDANKFEVIHA